MEFRAFGAAILFTLAYCPAQCAPVTFAQAVELSLRHNVGQQAPPAAPEIVSAPQCPAPRENFAALAGQLDTANEMGFPVGSPISNPPVTTAPADSILLDSRSNTILCAALLYEKLEDIQVRQRLVHRQEDLVRRLLDIESRRVSAEVDHPLLLTQAKMLRARTRMESADLAASEDATRAALGSLLGLSSDLPTVIEGSLPPLPERLTDGAGAQNILVRLLAFRDIVQLDYVAEFMSRQKAVHDMALARVSIGAAVAAQITEQMKLAGLIQFNNRVRAARIQLADSGKLESWALAQTAPAFDATSAPSHASAPDSAGPTVPQAPSGSSPQLLSLLIAPDIAELPIGKSRQYSAFATYSDGHAKEVTSEVSWSCSTDSGAVVSTTGLLTALDKGQLTIRAEFQGLSSQRHLNIPISSADEDLGPWIRGTAN